MNADPRQHRDWEIRDWDHAMGTRELSRFADATAVMSGSDLRRAAVRRLARQLRASASELRAIGRWSRTRRAPPPDSLVDAAFIWIPKTAGTSIWTELERHGGRKLKSPGALWWHGASAGLVTLGHMSWSAAAEAGVLDRDYASRAVTFAVVRNPFDRAVSLYEYSRARSVDPGLSFKTFLQVVKESEIIAPGLFNSVGLSQCAPQTAWVTDETGRLFPDHVGRLEDLGPTQRYLEDLLQRRVEFDQLNSSQRGDTDTYYCASTRQLVEQLYAADFEHFDY